MINKLVIRLTQRHFGVTADCVSSKLSRYTISNKGVRLEARVSPLTRTLIYNDERRWNRLVSRSIFFYIYLGRVTKLCGYNPARAFFSSCLGRG